MIAPAASSMVQPTNLASVSIADLAAPLRGHVRSSPRMSRTRNKTFMVSVMVGVASHKPSTIPQGEIKAKEC